MSPYRFSSLLVIVMVSQLLSHLWSSGSAFSDTGLPHHQLGNEQHHKRKYLKHVCKLQNSSSTQCSNKCMYVLCAILYNCTGCDLLFFSVCVLLRNCGYMCVMCVFVPPCTFRRNKSFLSLESRSKINPRHQPPTTNIKAPVSNTSNE